MPGVPKSCAVCQARKVKVTRKPTLASSPGLTRIDSQAASQCDRRIPACSQCVKYQWNCPGYPAARPKKKRSGPQSKDSHRLALTGRNSHPDLIEMDGC